jgi:hypothetical protein
MLPWYKFCQFGFFALVIHYIIAWYAQILWTPTYHITVPAARRVPRPGTWPSSTAQKEIMGDRSGTPPRCSPRGAAVKMKIAQS